MRKWIATIGAAVLTPMVSAATVVIFAITWAVERLQWARMKPEKRREESEKLIQRLPAK